jgi:hypothetical protein
MECTGWRQNDFHAQGESLLEGESDRGVAVGYFLFSFPPPSKTKLPGRGR